MQLVGATKTTTVGKLQEGGVDQRLYSLVWEHTLAALGSGRGEGMPTVVEPYICNV